MITGITRVRNEALIIADTLRHFLERCESILLYDDDSTDATVEIAASFDRVTVIRGSAWSPDRETEETRHRALLLDQVRTPWVLCFDADERLVGRLPALKGAGYRIRLFDGYLTPELDAPYTGGALEELPRMWGPEYRDILMLFRRDRATYRGLDRREPRLRPRVAPRLPGVEVKHFGKCISIEQWEETCDYYATHWPEPYQTKWADRRGKAIHTHSDFGRPLFTWEEVRKHGVRI